MFRSYMNASCLVRLTSAFALAMLVMTGSMALADEQPTPNANLKAGDKVVVTADETEIGRGTKTLQLLKKGTKAEIIQIRDGWVGVELQLEGKTLKGWIKRTQLSAVGPDTKAKPEASSSVAARDDKQASKEATTDASKTTLADKFAKMMEKVEQTETPAKPVSSTTEKPEAAKASPSDLASKDPVAAQDESTVAQPAVKTDATPATELLKPPAEEPTALPSLETREPAQVSAEPDQPKIASTDSAQQAEKGKAERKSEETKAASPPGPQTADKKDDAPASSTPIPSDPKLVPEATAPTKPQPPKKIVEPPVTEPPAEEKTDVSPPGGAQATGEEIGEGPEPLAEKFAEILERLKAQENKGAGAIEQPSVVPEKPQVTAPKESEQVEDPELDQPITINVLVLRNADDLMDVEASERIGRLILSGDQFNNRTLKSLDGLSVETLSIEAVNVSNAGIQYLKNVRGVKSLRLWSPAFDDRGLTLLSELRGLEALDLEGTSVEGTGLGDLKELKNLKMLVLGPKTLDSGIAQLVQLPNLQQLDLRACAGLTLDCVDSLSKLADLKVIWLPRHIRTKGKRALRVALPECQVRS